MHPRAGLACAPARRCPVIPPEFDYVRATSVDEAVSALGAGGDDVKVLAGGQGLIPLLLLRLANLSTPVRGGGGTAKERVRNDAAAIFIGPSTTHPEVLADPLV